MTIQTELKEYKELLEKQLKLTQLDSPIYMSQAEQDAWLAGVHSTALYALEMFPYSNDYEYTVLDNLKGWGNK